jgi:PAS domain-containing protein
LFGALPCPSPLPGSDFLSAERLFAATMSVIRRNELLNFTRSERRDEVLQLSAQERADLIEQILAELYKIDSKEKRNEMLALVQTVLDDDQAVSALFSSVAYIVCDSRLKITYVNQVWLDRSQVDAELTLGRVLYNESDYLDSEIEQMYSMVMETRLIGDALVRYRNIEKGYDGWFALVVIPLTEGGIGVLSKFATSKEELTDHAVDVQSPDAPRFISLS